MKEFPSSVETYSLEAVASAKNTCRKVTKIIVFEHVSSPLSQ